MGGVRVLLDAPSKVKLFWQHLPTPSLCDMGRRMHMLSACSGVWERMWLPTEIR